MGKPVNSMLLGKTFSQQAKAIKKARCTRAFCVLVNLKKLQIETDAKFVDALLFVAVGGVGGQEVKVDLETRGEDEPAALGTDGHIAAEFVELGAVG